MIASVEIVESFPKQSMNARGRTSTHGNRGTRAKGGCWGRRATESAGTVATDYERRQSLFPAHTELILRRDWFPMVRPIVSDKLFTLFRPGSQVLTLGCDPRATGHAPRRHNTRTTGESADASRRDVDALIIRADFFDRSADRSASRVLVAVRTPPHSMETVLGGACRFSMTPIVYDIEPDRC